MQIRGAVRTQAMRDSEFMGQVTRAARAGALAALERLIETALLEVGQRAIDLTRATVRNIAEWIKANW
ncbi:hypothetical protein [Streptomyces sp. ST2-7A]|uniref:hypothetical protein n=1 Tax=Streptomyces sp. ST2-7A TaxID=2907214 RepID=UPI001F40DB9B|nr:hypothetical protein [Streptomyces sp. ST2-7A]